MNATVLSDDELQFYYFGFYSVLRRYRYMTLLGWLVVATGFVGLMLAWNAGREHGIIETALGCACCAAGLGLVQNSVATLSSYVSVPFRSSQEPPAGTEQVPVILEIAGLMKEVEEGGWQEAYAAISKLKELETTHNLPHLDR